MQGLRRRRCCRIQALFHRHIHRFLEKSRRALPLSLFGAADQEDGDGLTADHDCGEAAHRDERLDLVLPCGSPAF